MTWYTTWQTGTGPAYAEHATEADAERHAAEIARGGGHVTVYEVDDEGEPTDSHETPTIAHSSDYRHEVPPGSTDVPQGPQIEREGIA